MKCIKCDSEIKQDAQFCPFCGAKQSVSSETKSTHISSSKMMLWALFVVLGLGCVIGAYYTLSSKGREALSANKEISNGDKELPQRLMAIYNDVFNGQGGGDNDEKYCSESYKSLISQFNEAYENSTLEGEMLGPECDHWTASQDAIKSTMEIIEVNKTSATNAIAKIHVDNGFEDSGSDIEIKLVFENGDWFIDDFIYFNQSERKIYEEAIELCKKNVSRVNKKTVGECYVINGVRYLSYSQMKFIAQNVLTKEEVDKFASLCNFPLISERTTGPSTSTYGANGYDFWISVLNSSNSTEFIRYCFYFTANQDYVEKLKEEIVKEKYIENRDLSVTGYIDDYWYAILDNTSLVFQRFQSKKLDLSRFQ